MGYFSSMNKTFYLYQYALWQETPAELLPDVSFIDPLQRRRMTDIEKIGLFLAHQITPPIKDYKVVFASRFGEWQQTLKLIKEFHSEKQMSPAGFSHSVHNAMPGLLSVLTALKNNYTTVSAQEKTIDNALVEVFTSLQPVLFIYAQEKAPHLYQTVLKDHFDAHGIAFFITPTFIPQAQKIEVMIEPSSDITSFQNLSAFLSTDKKLQTHYLKIKKCD